MFIQRQRLKSVLNAIVQIRVVEKIFLRGPGLQMQSFEPWDTWYTQRAHGIEHPDHLDLDVKPSEIPLLKFVLVLWIRNARFVWEGAVRVRWSVIRILPVLKVFENLCETWKASLGQKPDAGYKARYAPSSEGSA